jgi:hypothetical protein
MSTEEPQLSPFTQRVRDHPAIVMREPSGEEPRLFAMRDELLVSSSVSEQVRSWLVEQSRIAEAATPVTTLFTGIDPSGELEELRPYRDDDVELWKLVLPAADEEGAEDVFDLTARLRRALDGQVEPHLVSPNHVLIPAPNLDECPYGPPFGPVQAIPSAPTSLPQAAPITVVDCGYYWPENDPAWATNPLTERCQLTVTQAQWWNPGTGKLEDEPAGELDADGSQKLDALVGHANFVAGVIAQRCDQPSIALWNHNGGFSTRPDGSGRFFFIPNEHSVARSIILSQRRSPTPVIYVGFSAAALEDMPGPTWRTALLNVGDAVVVVPAGNHGGTHRRYPAGLRRQGLHRNVNVVSVAALNANGSGLADFSDRGGTHDPWVSCCAIGEHVVSTFLPVNIEPEEWDFPQYQTSRPPGSTWDFTASDGWAVWNGTSFAGPKVAAALAIELASTPAGGPPITPMQAWNRIRQGRQVVQAPNGDFAGHSFASLG